MAKKPITKRPWFWPVVCIVAVGAILGGNGDKTDENRNIPDESNQSVIQVDTSDRSTLPDVSESTESGTYTLPCGMELQFWSEVRNDVTGKWRRAATSDSFVPADYAVEYYNAMFNSDDELHSIWNATLKTTTSISVSGNLLFVDTYEYVSGEEHDAKIMFTGTKLDSRIIDKESGEPVELDTEPNPTTELE